MPEPTKTFQGCPIPGRETLELGPEKKTPASETDRDSEMWGEIYDVLRQPTRP